MGRVKESDPHIWQIGTTNSPSSGVVRVAEHHENPLWQINLIKPKKMPKRRY